MISTTVTIFIRVRNEARDLPRCLGQVAAQRINGVLPEVIVLDCQSDDGSADIARRFGAKVFSIPPPLFSYSSALAFGVAKATGEFFVPLSGHVIPLDDRWLQSLLAPLQIDRTVTASFSRQLVSTEASALERQACNVAFPDKSHVLTLEDARGNCSRSLYERVVFSNASACYRRSVLTQHPFREIPFAEDRLWAWEALLRGEKVAYAADSRCEHYHRPDFGAFRATSRRATFSRFLIERFVAEKLGCMWRTPDALQELLMYLKVPLSAILAAGAVSLRPVMHTRASIPFLAASIGTTLGKAEGISAFRESERGVIPFADGQAILEGAES